MKKTLLISSFILSIIFLLSCEDNLIQKFQKYENDDYIILSQRLNIPNEGLNYDYEFPLYYRGLGGPSTSPVDADLATLGRVLFYDTDLSGDKTVSCASCHDQSKAFSDDIALSTGTANRVGTRNSLALGSVFSFQEYYSQLNSGGGVPFLWDNSATSPQNQVSKAFTAVDEMGIEEDVLLERVREKAYYRVLYKYAFGTDQVQLEGILDALGTFVNSIGSFNSKYDHAFSEAYPSYPTVVSIPEAPRSFTSFSTYENVGMNLYLDNCSSCHGQYMNRPARLSENNGLELGQGEYDLGVGGANGNSYEMGNFKVPTLRNVALTAPYMHDGRFATLDDVIDHYSHGILNHPNLSHELKNQDGTPKQFGFTEEEKSQLIAFLQTLTDPELLVDEKYADPFK